MKTRVEFFDPEKKPIPFEGVAFRAEWQTRSLARTARQKSFA